MTFQNAPAAKAQMLIRKPIAEVFEAFVDPAITTSLVAKAIDSMRGFTLALAGLKPMGKSVELSKAHLRVARPSDDLVAVTKFYRNGLGFEILSEFKGHHGFDGVILGHKGAAYHLEFTRKRGHKAGRVPGGPTERCLAVTHSRCRNPTVFLLTLLLTIGPIPRLL